MTSPGTNGYNYVAYVWFFITLAATSLWNDSYQTVKDWMVQRYEERGIQKDKYGRYLNVKLNGHVIYIGDGHTLRRGMYSSEVYDVGYTLKQLGYSVTPSSTFNLDLEVAVNQFRSIHSLPAGYTVDADVFRNLALCEKQKSYGAHAQHW